MASMAVSSLKDLKELGRKLLSSRREINALPRLLQFVSPNHPPQFVLEALLSLQSFFIPILPQLPSSSKRRPKSSEKDLELDYKLWARERYDEFIEALIGVLVSPQSEEALKDVVLDAIMEFVKVGNGGRFQSSIYHKVIQSIVHSTTQVDVFLSLLASNFFKYIDVRYFTYISLDKVSKTLEADNNEDLSRESMESSIHHVHHILSRIPPLDNKNDTSNSEMWSGSGFSTKEDGHGEKSKEDKVLKTEKHSKNALSAASISKKMKLKFTKAWISFLRLPLPLEVYKEVLVTLHQTVIPYISNPIMLCDFLTRSYDVGGVVSVMALSSLYILMTQHGLEYPNFYDKLYALLVPSIFMAKFRAKFLELLDSCLKSPLLPAYLAAAFAKKLSRLSLLVPPSGSLVITALIHNLLRRHPSINCLVHRENDNEIAADDLKAQKQAGDKDDCEATIDNSSKKRGFDHFNNEESNPLKSNAMKSSLWEIDTLRHHYCPPVSRFVLSLENDLTVRAKTTEMNVKDFSSGSYGTIFAEEIRRRVKQVPLAFYKSAPASLFSETNFPGWAFNYIDSKEKHGEDENGNKSEEDKLTSGKRQRIDCSA